jgi:hypothetical protein
MQMPARRKTLADILVLGLYTCIVNGNEMKEKPTPVLFLRRRSLRRSLRHRLQLACGKHAAQRFAEFAIRLGKLCENESSLHYIAIMNKSKVQIAAQNIETLIVLPNLSGVEIKIS